MTEPYEFCTVHRHKGHQRDLEATNGDWWCRCGHEWEDFAPHSYLRSQPHDTEVEAAVAVTQTSAAQRRRVYDHIAAHPEGVADHEGEEALELKPQSYTPRRLELVESGLVFKTSERRKTESGRSAIVWKAVDFGAVIPSEWTE